MDSRIESFTRRQVRERERLFSPDRDDDYGYVIEILAWFIVGSIVGCALIVLWMISWP